MLLGDHEGYAAGRELPQRLTPSGLGGDIHHVVGLCRVEIVSLDPHAVGGPRLRRVGGDDAAHGSGDAALSEELDHPMAVGIADGGGRVNDDRPRSLHGREAVEDRPALTHDEQVCGRRFDEGVGVD